MTSKIVPVTLRRIATSLTAIAAISTIFGMKIYELEQRAEAERFDVTFAQE